MAKAALLIIIGMLLGFGLATVIQSFKPPPGRRSPRPNVFRKTKLQQWALPLGGGLVIAVAAWIGLSLLFPPGEPDQARVENAVRQPISSDASDNNGITEDTIGTDSGRSMGEPAPRGRKLLVANSPMAMAALQTAPVAGTLDRFGIGRRLTRMAPSRKSVAEASGEPQVQPKKAPEPGTQPAPEPPQPVQPPAPAAPAPPVVSSYKRPAEPSPGPVNASLKFTVHLASFSVKANADRSLARLKKAGVPAFLSRIEIDSTVYYRLMAGRFSTRDKAREYGEQLKQRGLTTDLGTFTVKPIVTGSDAG